MGNIWASVVAGIAWYSEKVVPSWPNEGEAMRQVVLHPGEDGYWVAECPSLPGCISQGETKETAIANIREAIKEYIAVLEDDGLPVPERHL